MSHSNIYGDRITNPHQAPDCFDRYLTATQSSDSSLDFAEIQSEIPSVAAGSDPEWFTDFILYGSEDPNFQLDSLDVSQSIESTWIDTSDDTSTIPLFISPTMTGLSIDDVVPNCTNIDQSSVPTNLDELSHEVAFDSNIPNQEWNPRESALNLPAFNHFENMHGEDSEQSSSTNSMALHNNTSGKLPIPRKRGFKCPICQYDYSSESRLSEHLRKSHAPAQFICGICQSRFKQEKDLQRHELTHRPSKQLFACTCTKAYARYDGLLRHFTEMAKRQHGNDQHRPV